GDRSCGAGRRDHLPCGQGRRDDAAANRRDLYGARELPARGGGTRVCAAPVSYRLEGEDLVFERSLGRPRNAVVLPSGWYCTFSSAPATVSQLPDGRGRLGYWKDRP